MPDEDTAAIAGRSRFVQQTSPGHARIDVVDVAEVLEILEGLGCS